MSARDLDDMEDVIDDLLMRRKSGKYIAKTIVSLGYRKPRTITTLEDLDALPVGSVILDSDGLSLHKNAFTGWCASNGAKEIDPEMMEGEALPATVLHEPVQS